MVVDENVETPELLQKSSFGNGYGLGYGRRLQVNLDESAGDKVALVIHLKENGNVEAIVGGSPSPRHQPAVEIGG